MSKLFGPGDILVPKNADMELWSVIACDQFTSQPEYWDSVDARVGDVPSTLRMIFPEAYLGRRDEDRETAGINQAMERYLEDGIFTALKDSFVYVEREMTVGGLRRGLVGLVDLECYDYAQNSASPIRCTEGTIESRLPPRVKVRMGAALELPHVVVFADDPDRTLFKGLEDCEKIYDFQLMDGGGRIVGRRVTGEAARNVEKALDALREPEYLERRYGLEGRPPAVFAMGDGNHSLATAKLCWEKIKPELSTRERESHPARYSLVELVSIHDDTVAFEPIHRVVFETDAGDFFREAEEFFASAGGEGDNSHAFTLLKGGESRCLSISGCTEGEAIALAQGFCNDYVNQHGGHIDYIHDDASAVSLSQGEGRWGMLFPPIGKDRLFTSIIKSGAFPAKSFSIGPARDKRYYLECRKIK